MRKVLLTSAAALGLAGACIATMPTDAFARGSNRNSTHQTNVNGAAAVVRGGKGGDGGAGAHAIGGTGGGGGCGVGSCAYGGN